MTRARFFACIAAAALTLVTFTARANEKLRVGKAIQNSFTFGLLDVGIASGVFAKNGFDIEPATFSGAARLQQALTSGDIDIALSTGQDLAFILKGLPAMTIAAVTNAPRESVMLVRPDGGITGPAGLKDKKAAVSNIRGYPSWLAIEFSKSQGWGPNGVTLIATGSHTKHDSGDCAGATSSVNPC